MRIKTVLLLPRLIRRKNQLQLITLLVLSIVGIILPGDSKANELDPATIKALYTYKFSKFTQWPDNKLNADTENFQYCILGQNPFSQQTLNMITGKSVQGLPLSIEVFNSGLVPEEILSTCHIVFISASEKHRLTTILTNLRNAPVLTVSDIQGFSDKGGMVTLVQDQGRLRFQINQSALQQAQVSISSKIMELAEIVHRGHR